MGTFQEGTTLHVGQRPEDLLNQPIPVAGGGVGEAADAAFAREHDRWTDRDGDDWLVVQTDDGLRLSLCDGEKPPPPKTAKRPAEYVHEKYGPLVLRTRRGRAVSGRIEMRTAR